MLNIPEKTLELLRASRFVIPVFADLHTDSPDDRHLKAQVSALCELREIRKPDAVISLGDMPAMLGRDRHASNAKVAALISGICEKLAEAAGAPLLAINGNHDAVGTDFFSPTLWRGAVKGFDRGLAKRDGDSVWYYADFGGYRFVFLSVPHDSELGGVYPTPLWSFGDEQLDWLERTLCRTTGKRIVIFSHVPFCSVYDGPDTLMDVWDGERVRKATRASLCGWIDDRERAESILKRHEIVCAVAGHEHYDSVLAPGELRNGFVNRLDCPQVIVSSHRVFKSVPEDFFERDGFSVIALNAGDTPSLKVILM